MKVNYISLMARYIPNQIEHRGLGQAWFPTTGLIMGDQATPSSLNLKIIQRYDPGARRIIFTGRHVVLYKFKDGSWVLDLLSGVSIACNIP